MRLSTFARRYLLLAGVVACLGAALHIAIALGGPGWYAFFGAPSRLVDMARAGNPRAPISCAVIAALLALFGAYAFSAAGIVRRLPFLRVTLGLIAAVLLLRGVLFVPLILWRPGALSFVCNCRRVDTFIIATSVLCLALGIGYAFGALATPVDPHRRH